MDKSKEALDKLGGFVKGGREYLDKSGTLPASYVTKIVGQALQDVLKYSIEAHHKVDETESDEELYVIHYTSIAALVSMLQDASKKEQECKEKVGRDKKPELEPTAGKNKSLWRLYDSAHLNDPDEGKYLTDNLNLPDKYHWLGKKDVCRAYITSFILPNSEDVSKELVYWRTYGKEGWGCSLSLCVPRSRLQRVHYGPEKVDLTVKKLRSVLDLLDPLVEVGDPLILEILTKTVWESLESIRYLYKNNVYEYEHECRIIVVESNIPDKDKICFEYQDRNNSPALLRHYYEHEDLQIKDLMKSGSLVTLGPCVPYRDDVHYCIETLKKRAKVGLEIETSKIPYLNRKY